MLELPFFSRPNSQQVQARTSVVVESIVFLAPGFGFEECVDESCLDRVDTVTRTVLGDQGFGLFVQVSSGSGLTRLVGQK